MQLFMTNTIITINHRIKQLQLGDVAVDLFVINF